MEDVGLLKMTRRSLGPGGWSGLTSDGLASLEYPRSRHHAMAADRDAIKVIGDRFEAGIVFAFNIDLLDRPGVGQNVGQTL